MVYQNIFDTEVPTEAQQQAIAAKLRGDDARATLALLSGDPTLTRVGNSIKTSNKEKAEGLRKTIDSIETRNAQAAEAEAKREFQGGEYQANRDQEEQHHQDDLTLERKKAEAKKLLDQENLTVSKEANRIAANNAQGKLDQEYFAMLEKTKLGEMGSLAQQINQAIEPYLDKDGKVVKDIPGISGFEQKALNTTAGSLFASPEAKRNHSLMSSFANIVLRDRSGAAVTDQEFLRLQNELRTKIGNGDTDVVEAYQRTMERYQFLAQQLAIAYGKAEGDLMTDDIFSRNHGLPPGVKVRSGE